MRRILFLVITLLIGLSGTVFGDFDMSTFLGEWEFHVLLEINEGVLNQDEPGEYLGKEVFTVSFWYDDQAWIDQGGGVDPIEITWVLRGSVLELTWPSAGDFQYSARYTIAEVENGEFVFICYDMQLYPRVGVMKRLSIAG